LTGFSGSILQMLCAPEGAAGIRYRLKELQLTGSGGSISQMPHAPEGATGIRYIDR
jgi:hypothetical protein